LHTAPPLGWGVKWGFNRLYQIAKRFAMGRCLLDDYQETSGFENIIFFI